MNLIPSKITYWCSRKNNIAIYLEGTKVTDVAAPWSYDQLAQLSWTQSADTLLLCHPDVPPQELKRLTSGWSLNTWSFYTANNIIYQPYYQFADNTVTLTPSAVSGSITLTASANFFVSDHNNTRLRVQGMEVLITAVLSPTVVQATTQQDLPNTTASTNWQEQAYSPVHGWPICVCFHQNRLVVGGSRDLPNRLWLSQSGNLFNFDLGTALDDQAIEFGILSDQVNAIRAVFFRP